MMKHKLAAFQQYIRYQHLDVPGLAREFRLNLERQKTGMISTSKRILDITEEEIDAMSDELMELYPAAIAVYYEECIRSMQDWMRQF